MESFGARLRRQREQQNIALVTIAEQTKIKVSLLEALERDDVSRWPVGIFRRAYIRAYAHAIGLSPDQIVREFLESYPDPDHQAEPVEAIAAAHGITQGASGAPTRLHLLVDSALTSLSRLRRSSPDSESRAVDPRPLASGEAWNTPNVPTLDQGSVRPEADPHAIADQPPARDARFLELASVCTELARIDRPDRLQQWLQRAAHVLDGAGLIVWVWHEASGTLTPALVYGYSDQVVAQLPAVTPDADNVTAAAFRSGVACVEPGTEHVNGALAVPLPTPSGSSGVLAVELRDGAEGSDSALVIASILAAMLAQLIGERSGADAEARAPEPVAVSAATRRAE